MNYVEMFKETGRIWWRTRAMWALGMLAALFGQGEYGFSGNYSQSGGPAAPSDPGDFQNPFESGPLADFIANPWPWVAGILVVALIWAIVNLLLGWLAQGAMISMVDTLDRGGEASIGASLGAAGRRLPSLILIAIVLGLPTLLLIGIALALFAPLFWQIANGGDFESSAPFAQIMLVLACAFPLIFIAAAAGAILSLVNIVAARSCVVEGLGVLASIRRAWRIIRRNLADALINWVALGACAAAYSLLASLPALVLLVLVGPAVLAGDWAAAAAGGVGLLGYALVVSVLIGGALTSFNSAMWTRVYRVLAARTDQ